MPKKEQFLFKSRDYKTIKLFKEVTEKQWNDPEWQIKNSIRDVEQLKKVIKLNPYQVQEIKQITEELRGQGKDPLRITPYYASLMPEDPFNPDLLYGEKPQNRIDPIFWQCVPTPAHTLFNNTGVEGAMAEEVRSYGAAYQRYPNRVALFIAENTSCASYCTHCQRTKSLDTKANIGIRDINKALFYINYNTNIDEVLVTGGDALMTGQKKLRYILEELSRVSHLRVIRIATRVPVVLPMAINDDVLSLIKISSNKYNEGYPKHVYFMTHVNHYHEITEELAKAVRKINDYGFTVRNQTVLLNHVNDYYKTLLETFRRMLWIGIHPYYLLQCHKEKGLVHFITPVQVGKIYIKHLQGWLSGVTRPIYAANVHEGGGKILLMPSGHDTMHTSKRIEDEISESFANVYTWDGKVLDSYEALGKSSQEEYNRAVEIMDRFIGRKGVFKPKIIIVDKNGKHIKTTNREKLPLVKNKKKSALLEYDLYDGEMPLTNPAEIAEKLDQLFAKTPYIKSRSYGK